MTEYIEREAAKKVLAFGVGVTAANALDNVPAANVVPVVHAEWIVCGDGDNVPWMCSHCGKTTAHKYKTMYGNYCPNCGARMDGE